MYVFEKGQTEKNLSNVGRWVEGQMQRICLSYKYIDDLIFYVVVVSHAVLSLIWNAIAMCDEYDTVKQERVSMVFAMLLLIVQTGFPITDFQHHYMSPKTGVHLEL